MICKCGNCEVELDVEEMIKVLKGLAEKQMKSIIQAVNKKGLMNTGWDDIDSQGGYLDFKVMCAAISTEPKCIKITKIKE